MTMTRYQHSQPFANAKAKVPLLFSSTALSNHTPDSPVLCTFILQDGEITIGTRDGAAHVLRCLKVWYDLPHDVLFTAINLVDRFLTKMKVRPKHMACISVGSLILAVKQLGLLPIDTDDLVAISQVSFVFRCLAPGATSIQRKENVWQKRERSFKRDR